METMVNAPSLKTVLENISSEQVELDRSGCPVGPLRLDSRQVSTGDTFIAVEGFQTDGRVYIPMALQQGAGLIIADDDNSDEFKVLFADLPMEKIIWVKNLRNQISELAANYYGHPSEELKNIAVTGTNGKTSCSYLIARTLQKLNFECYLMGTLGVGSCGDLRESENTTADAITLQAVLKEALDSGAQFSAMEISSHGLDQNRATAIQFNTAIFTNLTRDHLDYHETMEKYAAAKRKLFLHEHLKNVVLNVDDKFGRKLAKDDEIRAQKWLTTTQMPPSGARLEDWIWAEDVNFSLRGIHAKIYTPWGTGKLDSPLIGQFNLSNLLLVVAALGSILNELQPILEALKNVSAADGRMQSVGNDNTPTAIVDYAHTPDALEKALNAVREHCSGLIWCVFGCGGDRDSGKRPLMAAVAEKLSNRVIVTQDNPRLEDEASIKADIFAGFKRAEKAVYISDREQAIAHAISHAQPSDAILIAGKGHEDYQIIGKTKNDFSDIKVAQRLLQEYCP
jgi:UDP-N-acetylmuramoyl-L-alanyl-D-glutamate--2,6-diaminopimelate ligase